MEGTPLNKDAFKYALINFGKGQVFEDFAQPFLATVLGDKFIPVGGTKDKGIDGSMRLYSRNVHPTFIYQISTELDYSDKVEDSIQKLIENKVSVDKLIYVTNRKINDKNAFEDMFYEKHAVPLTIYDVDWFSNNVEGNEQLEKLYEIYIKSNIHEFQKPDKTYVATNFVTDPRLYVFMRQHFESSESSLEIEEKLANTLILYSLEGTASEKKDFRNSTEIKSQVSQYVKFDPKLLNDTIETQLKVLSTKPNKQINYHKAEDAYCLPYSTRLKLNERDILERSIYEQFQVQTTTLLKKYLNEEGIKLTRALDLIENTVHNIYHKQGIEFSAFIIEGQSRDILEDALSDIVGQVVDDSHVVAQNKGKVKKALLMTIRSIVYNGSFEQREYLRRLSSTYNMIFMLRWDPQLATSFQKIASELRIYVGTSILIPAMSEIFLDKNKRRYWNLLEGAHLAGVKLLINDTILDELVQHFGMVRYKYKTLFKSVEEIYLEDEMSTLYIDEILIRAYFYSKSRGQVKKFSDFIAEFAHPSLSEAKRDLRSFLEDEFHVTYEDTREIEAKINSDDVKVLTEALKDLKRSKEKAVNDARLMLMVYKLRELNNEEDGRSVFGFKTWWLSKDIYTYQAIKVVFGNRFSVNCYMRTDFLYNYISLSPKKQEIDNMFKEIFPSMLGINLSYHMPKEICAHINKGLVEHSERSPTRIKRAIRNYTERLMSTKIRNQKKLMSFWDEELKKASSGESI